VFSGGGYFRLLPRSLVLRLFDGSDYVMTYFHPRDFDPEQPILPELSLVRRFKTYVGLRGALTKLEQLLSRFEFIDIAMAEGRINWQAVERVRLDAIFSSAR
jgi:hypothetical protein